MKVMIIGLLVLIAADHLGDRWFDHKDKQETAANAHIQLARQ